MHEFAHKIMSTVFLSISFFLSFLACFVPSLRNFLRASLRFFEQLKMYFFLRSKINKCQNANTCSLRETGGGERVGRGGGARVIVATPRLHLGCKRLSPFCIFSIFFEFYHVVMLSEFLLILTFFSRCFVNILFAKIKKRTNPIRRTRRRRRRGRCTRRPRRTRTSTPCPDPGNV